MILPTYINVNRNGIPAVMSTGITVTSTEVQIHFNNHRNVGAPFRGLIIVNIAQGIPTGTTSTLPVVFTSQGNPNQPLLGYNNTPITAGMIEGTGIRIVWFDGNTLQLCSQL